MNYFLLVLVVEKREEEGGRGRRSNYNQLNWQERVSPGGLRQVNDQTRKMSVQPAATRRKTNLLNRGGHPTCCIICDHALGKRLPL